MSTNSTRHKDKRPSAELAFANVIIILSILFFMQIDLLSESEINKGIIALTCKSSNTKSNQNRAYDYSTISDKR